MYEIIKNIFVGSEDDYLNYAAYEPTFSVIHCKGEPYYSMGLAEIGYRNTTLKGFHYCYYKGSLALNYSIYDNTVFIVEDMFEECFKYINNALEQGQKVLVHCQEGVSRSPSVVFYYLIRGEYFSGDFDNACQQFYKLYPSFTPNTYIMQFLRKVYDNQH